MSLIIIHPRERTIIYKSIKFIRLYICECTTELHNSIFLKVEIHVELLYLVVLFSIEKSENVRISSKWKNQHREKPRNSMIALYTGRYKCFQHVFDMNSDALNRNPPSESLRVINFMQCSANMELYGFLKSGVN